MKHETHIEVVVLVAGALAVGGWFGFKALHGRRADSTEVPATVKHVTPPTRPVVIVSTTTTLRAAAHTTPPSTQPRSNRVAVAAIGGATTTVSAPVTPPTITTVPARPGQAADGAELAEARRLLAEGKEFEARAIFTRLILAAPEGPGREELRRTLDEINAKLFFSRALSPDSVHHVVQRGETLAVIAKRFNKDVYFTHLIMKINGISDARRIRADQKLKIPQGDFSGIVQKGAHRLIILLNGHYIKEYPIATGATATPTPEGSFIIENNKQMNPDWYAPDGRIIKFGEPENILGTRWLGFKETDLHRGYGIHGTSDPASVGTDASNGCIRMHNADVEEVFGMLMPGNTVEIIR